MYHSTPQGAVKYSLSSSEDEFDSAPKKKAAAITDDNDDDSFVPEPSAAFDSEVDSPAPPLKAPKPT